MCHNTLWAYLCKLWPCKKIAGCKRPALVHPSHKVCQGGKGSVWNGQTDGRTGKHCQSTSGPLPAHFRSNFGLLPDGWTEQKDGRALPVHFWSLQVHFWFTSGQLLVHLGTIGDHMRHQSYGLPKKLTFAKFAQERTEKNVTSKDPFRINTRVLKNLLLEFLKTPIYRVRK